MSSKTKRKRINIFDVINIMVMIMLCLLTLLPVMHVAAKAFSAQEAVISGKISFFPVGFQLDSVKYVLNSSQFTKSFRNTVVITIIGTLIAVSMTVCAAYPLSKPEFVGRKPFLYLFVFTMVFNAGMVPNYILFRQLNLLNTLKALIIPALFSSFNLFLVKNYFESLPEVLEDAARIDGANNFKIFTKVVLPISLPVIATITLFYAITYWGCYFSGVMYITNQDLKPLQQYMYDLITQANSVVDSAGNVDMDAAMNLSGENIRSATIVVSTVPVLIVYPFLQRYFVKGITIGSVKG